MICMYALGSRVPAPPLPMVSPPPPPPRLPAPGPRAPGPPLLPAVGPAQPKRTHANQREGGRWRMIPASASSQERRTASEQGQGHRLQGEKSNIIFCMEKEHVTMTLLLTRAATIPYLCRTHCPTQAGRGEPKRPQAPPYRAGRGQGM